jgi:hypothetical protein
VSRTEVRLKSRELEIGGMSWTTEFRYAGATVSNLFPSIAPGEETKWETALTALAGTVTTNSCL